MNRTEKVIKRSDKKYGKVSTSGDKGPGVN